MNKAAHAVTMAAGECGVELFGADADIFAGRAVAAYLAALPAVTPEPVPAGWEVQAKNFMRVIDRLTAENEALKSEAGRARSDAGWAENIDRQGGA